MNNKQQQVFFQIHQGLPREGPGDYLYTQSAFVKMVDLPPHPQILDIGCGPGAQTVDLAHLTNGEIMAIDNHDVYVEELKQRVINQGLSKKITVVQADMFNLDFPPETFDVIWAEGSIYIIGFETGLRQWQVFLKNKGYLAASELTWLRPDPPKALKDFWDQAYPPMNDVAGNLNIIANTGYKIIDYFVLPQSAWWNYYEPLERKLQVLQNEYLDDLEAMEVIEMEKMEIEFYRQYSEYYGYVFYVMQNS
ncbi:methyltransferase domain-containing protein [Anabaenopsis tanganyikae CS-531]|uniref:Methyltransferase domain-containing protein n=2 Tax=Anabaenopsis TaxID=110103 RepID=A0ABT5ATB9_9CYAN|nr:MULTISPECIES: class I SAM-dependent methyltransferase [Anabaenopsis]MDB9540535.1 methyltransferase domain-containing protein [Anabaenopsis arnoldii]MDH6092934.1 methyltransferase domain-containing protein [Anabaenopsis arnoldii]MDH6105563.1 methyltransferase domain-containing protein [Anabaenopsis tanganyikae CS-531]